MRPCGVKRIKPPALPFVGPWTCTILGPPRTKKNHGRRVQVRGRTLTMPSLAFVEWENLALPQIAVQCAARPPRIGQPVNLRAIVYRETAVGDLVGYLQAIADVLEKACAVVDDKWIVSFDGSRLRKDADRPRVEIVLSLAD